MSADHIISLQNNPTLQGMAALENDIVYSHAIPGGIKLSLLTPWQKEGINAGDKYPLIVFVQGSAWTFPNINAQIPQLADYARAGYVVATVTHRNTLDGHPFPAFLEDVKTAIRFLKANADAYHIDKNKVCIWGTSSGGNTALLAGFTADDARYKTSEYADESDGVQAVVECFGPTDMPELFKGLKLDGSEEGTEIFVNLCKGWDVDEALREMSPVNHVLPGVAYPPVMIIHGDEDPIVPYEQGVVMLEKLDAVGARAEMIRVLGAEHEGTFWSRELHARIKAFIDKHLKG